MILVSGLCYLGVWWRARRAKEWFLEDARAGRIRRVRIRRQPLKDEQGEEAFPETAGGMMGYERPHTDNQLWWILLLALLAGWMMHLEPWNSYVLKALLRDPVGAFTHGVPAPPRGR